MTAASQASLAVALGCVGSACIVQSFTIPFVPTSPPALGSEGWIIGVHSLEGVIGGHSWLGLFLISGGFWQVIRFTQLLPSAGCRH